MVQQIHVLWILSNHVGQFNLCSYKFQISFVDLWLSVSFIDNKFQEVQTKLICDETNRKKRVIGVMEVIWYPGFYWSWTRGSNRMTLKQILNFNMLYNVVVYKLLYGTYLFDVHKYLMYRFNFTGLILL